MQAATSLQRLVNGMTVLSAVPFAMVQLLQVQGTASVVMLTTFFAVSIGHAFFIFHREQAKKPAALYQQPV